MQNSEGSSTVHHRSDQLNEPRNLESFSGSYIYHVFIIKYLVKLKKALLTLTINKMVGGKPGMCFVVMAAPLHTPYIHTSDDKDTAQQN